VPIFNRQEKYIINIGNPIYKPLASEQSVLSNGVYVTNVPELVYFEDQPIFNKDIGKIRMFYYASGSGGKIYVKDVGTVDYSQGIIILEDLILTGIGESGFSFTIKPDSNDVVSKNNEIIAIPYNLVNIIPIIDQPADKYQFTPSHN
jgi:hypothetical protein